MSRPWPKQRAGKKSVPDWRKGLSPGFNLVFELSRYEREENGSLCKLTRELVGFLGVSWL